MTSEGDVNHGQNVGQGQEEQYIPSVDKTGNALANVESSISNWSLPHHTVSMSHVREGFKMNLGDESLTYSAQAVTEDGSMIATASVANDNDGRATLTVQTEPGKLGTFVVEVTAFDGANKWTGFITSQHPPWERQH